MKTIPFCALILYIINPACSTTHTFFKPLPEDGKMNFTELGAKYGHAVEEHEVVTEDGYILRLFHIPGKRKTPVFLIHGIADSADTFIVRGNKSLVIFLADAEYDVWAGNTRGNRYSRRHIKLDPDKDLAFWDYSFHECGIFDLPAMIDYILQATGENKLQTIGHSQGTSAHFVLLSKKPEYNEKIKIFIALAPVVYVSYLIPPVSTIAEHGQFIGDVLKSWGIEETFPEKSPLTAMMRSMCAQDVLGYQICFLSIGFYLTGFDTRRFESSFLKVVIGHYPGSTSRKSLLHFGQIALNKRFCEYDYGDKENVDHYGFMVPPDYNVRNVSTKVALLVGRNDPLSRVKDVEILRTVLPNIVHYQVMKSKSWNHIDFVWGNDMQETLFPHIFQLLKKYD